MRVMLPRLLCTAALGLALGVPARAAGAGRDAGPESALRGDGAAPESALRADDGECAYELGFDPARIAEARLRKLLRLRHGYAGTWIAELVAVNALPWLDPLDAVGAAVPRMEAVLARFDAELRREPPPAELAPVVAWTRADLEFQLWLTRTELDFCRTGEPSTLARPLGELETPARCAEEIWLVDQSLLGQCREACLSWGSCVASVFHARRGPFPEAAWQAFLRAEGISVRAIACDGR
jgi:hypothetical protein